MSFSYSPNSQSVFRHKRSASDMTERIAKEIQLQKAQEEAQRREIERILGDSEDLRKFKEKIKTAYMSKERAAQVADNQIKRLEDIKRDAEMDDIMLSAEQKAMKTDRMRETQRMMQRQIGNNIIKNQIEEKRQRSVEAYQQYLKEKDQIDMILQKTREDDIRVQAEAQRKKHESYNDMMHMIAMKKEKEYRDKQLEEEEHRRYVEFTQKKDDRESKLKAQRAKIEASREQIRSNLRAKEEERMRQEEWMNEMRHQLYKEENDLKVEYRSQQERERRQMQKTQLVEAQQGDFLTKMRRQQEEANQQAEYQRELSEIYAKNVERERQLRQTKRLKDQEFKQEVDKISLEKWLAQKQEREKELIEVKKQQDEERLKQDLVRREKERLMKEHLPYLDGFLSPSMLNSPKTPGSSFMINTRKTKIY